MDLTYRNSESTVEPLPIEMSTDSVFIRRNITTEKRIDPTSENEIKYYVYEEAVLSKDDFNTYSSEIMSMNAIKDSNNAENILQILASQSDGSFNQIAIMEALADIYLLIAEANLA